MNHSSSTMRNQPQQAPLHHSISATRAALTVAALSSWATTARADPFFTDVTEFSLPAPQPCTDPATGEGEGCYTNWLALSDLDGDGDLDIVLANGGGYYEEGNAEPSVVYFNDGKGAFRDVTASLFASASSRLRQVSIGDVDGDGDLDLYQPGGYGIDADKLWIQTSAGAFEDQALTHLPAESFARVGSAHLADLDGDGDLDLVAGDWGDASTTGLSRVVLLLNDGAGVFARVAAQAEPSFSTISDRLPPTLPVDGTLGTYWGRRPIDIDTADIDGDFDLDILVNHRDGVSRILLNDGAANFSDGNAVQQLTNEDASTSLVSNYPEKVGPYAYNQELCDIDGDGDLDLLIDNAGAPPEGVDGGNFTQLLINDGAGKFSDESRALIFGEPGSDDNAVKCVDVNDDGHYDLLVASLQNDREKLLLNDGAGIFNYVADAFPAGVDPTLGIDVGDLDGDGVFDVVTGQGEADPKINRVYRGGGVASADTLAPIFRAIQTPVAVPDEPTVFRVAVRDGVTSETGEHLKDVSVGYTGASESGSVQGHFVGGDLYRIVLPAQPNGTTLTLTPSATDRQGNVGSAAPIVLAVGTAVDAVDAGSEVTPPDVDAPADAGGEASSADAGVPALNPPVSAVAGKKDGGCSLPPAGGGTSRGGLLALGLTLTAWLARRESAAHRRRRTRATSSKRPQSSTPCRRRNGSPLVANWRFRK